MGPSDQFRIPPCRNTHHTGIDSKIRISYIYNHKINSIECQTVLVRGKDNAYSLYIKYDLSPHTLKNKLKKSDRFIKFKVNKTHLKKYSNDNQCCSIKFNQFFASEIKMFIYLPGSKLII